jgi:hypothetical protein
MSVDVLNVQLVERRSAFGGWRCDLVSDDWGVLGIDVVGNGHGGEFYR